MIATIIINQKMGKSGNKKLTMKYKSKAESTNDAKIPSVKIGRWPILMSYQEWMTENLNVDKFRNGDPIPEARSISEWEKAGDEIKPAWCYYDNDPANGKIYGKLYSWYAVDDPRGLAPEGWHVPSDKEWTKLTNYLGGESKAGGKLKSTSLWVRPNEGATNESGFSGLPGGFRDGDGFFLNIGNYGYWWSSSETNTDSARFQDLLFDRRSVLRNLFKKYFGLSVRCLRD